MKKKYILLVTISLLWHSAFAQITIEECYQKAKDNYPMIKQYNLIEKVKEYSLSNASKGYLPQVLFSAKVTYQSDVTKIPFDPSLLGIGGMKIPSLNKDQYGATLDVNQILWDGGVIRSKNEEISTNNDVNRKNIDVNIYAINERVNQLYFGILLADAQISQNELLQENLLSTYEQVQSYVTNGIGNQSDLDAVKVDQLRAKQDNIQFMTVKKAYIEVLSKLIGEEISMVTLFKKPDMEYLMASEIRRPELDFYNAQIRNLQAKNKSITSDLMPKLSLFVTGGYGYPGLNMFKDKFAPYYVGGVKLTWNLASLYTQKNNRRQIETNINFVENQREIFLFNTSLDILQKNNTIVKYKKQLKYDDEIIQLRSSVKKASEAKMANGTLSGTDLVRDINAEQMAILDKIFHEAELLLAIYNLKFTVNN